MVGGGLLVSLLQDTVAPGRKQALRHGRRASGPGAAIIGEIRSTQNVERTIQPHNLLENSDSKSTPGPPFGPQA